LSHQDFLAKRYATLVLIRATFIATSASSFMIYALLFTETVTGGGTNLTVVGGFVGILLLAAALAVVVSWGVTVGSLSSGTVLGISIFWILIFVGLAVSTQLPAGYPNPKRTFDSFRYVLRGEYTTNGASE